MIDNNEPTYRIGAVSRLTGISAETLRMWERRYGVVIPCRSGGRNRLYTHEDIGRLALLKRLVDAGDAIGSIAHLSLDQLQERIELHQAQGSLNASDTKHGHVRPRVVMLGDALPALVAEQGSQLDAIELVGVYRERRRFEAELAKLKPDVIVVEYPTVHSQTAAEIKTLLARCRARHALIVYGFGAEHAVAELDTPQIMPLRAPVGLPELRQTILATAGGGHERTREHGISFEHPEGSLPPRRFSSETLAKIATVSTAVYCECPHHLVELIRGLAAFEAYSAECKDTSPKDASLHEMLEATTARARALMEDALAHVVAAEQLKL